MAWKRSWWQRRVAEKRRAYSGIPRRAVDAFLRRKRRDFSRYTSKSRDWLQARVEALPVKPPIWHRLRKEQQVGFVAGVEMRKFCFWYDMGMGKTLLSIALARYFRRYFALRGLRARALVLVPNKINKEEWVDEIKKHSPRLSYTVLRGSSADKWKQLLRDDSALVIETYGGLVRLLCSQAKDQKKNKTRLAPNRALVKKLFDAGICGLFMDESIMITRKKGHGSLMHRLCRHIAKRGRFAFALNGTPFGRDPTDMWGQFYIIDEGETLGETLGLFRAAFFKEKVDQWGRIQYEFDNKKMPLLNQIITNRSIRYEADESTLPRVTKIIKRVSLPLGADNYYAQARKELIAAHGMFTEQKNAFLRMRQISSGFIGYNDDETGEKAKYEFPENPKLDMLMSLVDALTTKHKMVIFHDFIYSGDMIVRRLNEKGIMFSRIYGQTKDGEAQLARFYGDENYRVMVLQNNSGGFGLNRLRVARYGVYYESPVGTVLRKQTERRIRRQGSEHGTVFLYDLVVPGTVDEQILNAHEAGFDLFEAIIDRKVAPNALHG